jgi:hypothetical protein
MIRALGNGVEIDASKRRCGDCRFVHPEHSHCIWFGFELDQIWEIIDGEQELDHYRHPACRKTEHTELVRISQAPITAPKSKP